MKLAAFDDCGFEETMNALIVSYARERQEALDEGYEDEDHRQTFERLKAAAERCLAQYHEHMAALADEWLQSDDEYIRHIGESVRDNDYSGLAW